MSSRILANLVVLYHQHTVCETIWKTKFSEHRISESDFCLNIAYINQKNQTFKKVDYESF